MVEDGWESLADFFHRLKPEQRLECNNNLLTLLVQVKWAVDDKGKGVMLQIHERN